MSEAKEKVENVENANFRKMNFFQRRINSIKSAPIYWSLALVNLVLLLAFGSVFSDDINSNFILKDSTVLAQPWTIVTSAFMHAGFLHLFFNMYVLGFMLKLKKNIGEDNADFDKSLILVYVLSMFSASVFVIMFSNSEYGTVGASGAIFGIIGYMMCHYKFRKHTLNIFFLVLVNFAIGFLLPNVSWQAHLGGLIAGIVIAIIFNIIHYCKLFPKEKVRNIKENGDAVERFMHVHSRKSILFFSDYSQEKIDFVKQQLGKTSREGVAEVLENYKNSPFRVVRSKLFSQQFFEHDRKIRSDN